MVVALEEVVGVVLCLDLAQAGPRHGVEEFACVGWFLYEVGVQPDLVRREDLLDGLQRVLHVSRGALIGNDAERERANLAGKRGAHSSLRRPTSERAAHMAELEHAEL
jgi:hypothetical protein